MTYVDWVLLAVIGLPVMRCVADYWCDVFALLPEAIEAFRRWRQGG
jgi:hypothetical protein